MCYLDIFSLSYLTMGIGIPTLIHSIYYSSYTWKAVRNMPPLAITLIGCTLGKAHRLPQDALIISLTNLTVKLNNIISLLLISSNSIDSNSITDPLADGFVDQPQQDRGGGGLNLAVETEILDSEVGIEDPIINSVAIGEVGGVRHYPQGQIHRP